MTFTYGTNNPTYTICKEWIIKVAISDSPVLQNTTSKFLLILQLTSLKCSTSTKKATPCFLLNKPAIMNERTDPRPFYQTQTDLAQNDTLAPK